MSVTLGHPGKLLLARRFAALSMLFNGRFGLDGVQIDLPLGGELFNHPPSLAEYLFQLFPEFRVVQIVSRRIVRFRRFGELLVSQTPRREIAAFTPAVAVIVNARDEARLAGEFNQFFGFHKGYYSNLCYSSSH